MEIRICENDVGNIPLRINGHIKKKQNKYVIKYKQRYKYKCTTKNTYTTTIPIGRKQ